MKARVAICAMVMIGAGSAVLAAETPAPAKTTTPPAKKTGTAAAGKPAPGQLGMSVTGTQDSPKVLYIVPWKTIDAVPAEPYVSGLLDEVFAPVDPVEFERSVHQHQQLQTPAEAGVGP